MEFEIEDTIEEINKNAKTIETISIKDVDIINSKINQEMQKVTQDFRNKQNQSLESASKAFLTF